jgi:PAS domain S-box-containing protein
MAEKPTYDELENRINQLMAERSSYAKLEAEQKRSIRFTESMLSAIPMAIFFKDVQGRYQGCNPAFTEIMGVTAQEMHGKTVHELWPSEHAEVYHQRQERNNPARHLSQECFP